MAMKQIKVAEATGPALDWLVAKCEGKSADCEVHAGNVWYGRVTSGFTQYSPSTNWAQGGPILERENICIRGVEGGFHAWYHQTPPKMFGTTMLIAAMRCYVTSKLGDTAEVPEELL